jgi:hypothetical protein
VVTETLKNDDKEMLKSREEMQRAVKKFSIFWKLTESDTGYIPF